LHACRQESLNKPSLYRLLSWLYLVKLVYSYFAVALARPVSVVMPDAPEHGARFQAMSRADAALLADLQQNFRSFRAARGDNGRRMAGRGAAGGGGASMGGMTALGIMTHHPEVKASPV
jgi:S-formylglutathione hydrolase FrmB